MYYLDLCEAATDALLLLVTNSRGKVYFRDSSVQDRSVLPCLEDHYYNKPLD